MEDHGGHAEAAAMIKQARKRLDFTQHDVAERMAELGSRVTQRAVSKWESGERPTFDKLADLARVLQLDENELIANYYPVSSRPGFAAIVPAEQVSPDIIALASGKRPEGVPEERWKTARWHIEQAMRALEDGESS